MVGNTALTSVTIPSNVVGIGTTATSGTQFNNRKGFSGCTKLTSVNFSTGLTTIGLSAFENCSSLASIQLPIGLTTIGNNAFSGCSALTSLEIPKTVASMGTISGLSKLEKYVGPVEALSSNCFSGNKNLKKVFLYPATTATKIPSGCFYNCTNLEEANVPAGITELTAGSFLECSSLSLTIPPGVTVDANSCKSCKSAFQADISQLTGIEYNTTTGTATVSEQAYASADKFKSVSGKEYNEYSNNVSQIKTITGPFCPANIVFDGTYPEGVFNGSVFDKLLSVTVNNTTVESLRLDENFPDVESLTSLSVNASEDNLKELGIPRYVTTASFTGCSEVT